MCIFNTMNLYIFRLHMKLNYYIFLYYIYNQYFSHLCSPSWIISFHWTCCSALWDCLHHHHWGPRAWPGHSEKWFKREGQGLRKVKVHWHAHSLTLTAHRACKEWLRMSRSDRTLFGKHHNYITITVNPEERLSCAARPQASTRN